MQSERLVALRLLFVELLEALHGAPDLINADMTRRHLNFSSPDTEAETITDFTARSQRILKALVPLRLEPSAQPIMVVAEQAAFETNHFLGVYIAGIAKLDKSSSSKFLTDLADERRRVLTPLLAKLAADMRVLLDNDDANGSAGERYT